MSQVQPNTNTEEYRQEEAAGQHARLEIIAEKYGCAVSNAVPEFIGEWTELIVTPIDDSYEMAYEENGFEGELIRQQIETVVGRIVDHCPRELFQTVGSQLFDYSMKLERKELDDDDI